jgi:hypothetical protein
LAAAAAVDVQIMFTAAAVALITLENQGHNKPTCICSYQASVSLHLVAPTRQVTLSTS